jgi:hypothetical protein
VTMILSVVFIFFGVCLICFYLALVLQQFGDACVTDESSTYI